MNILVKIYLVLACCILLTVQVQAEDNSVNYLQTAHNLKSQNKHLQAQKYYKLTCDANHPSGCYNLASFYFYGDFMSPDLEQDLEQARKLFNKSCNLGSGQACYNLGAFYRYGKGVSPDMSKAVLYFERGCQLNNTKSCDIYEKIGN